MLETLALLFIQSQHWYLTLRLNEVGSVTLTFDDPEAAVGHMINDR